MLPQKYGTVGAVRLLHRIRHQYQIAGEPNNPDPALGGNGSFPRVREAIIAGVLAAKDEAQQHGYTFQTGFNATPSFDPNDDFWPSMAALGSTAFIEALDYVGLDFFPDVFHPLPRLADGSIMPLADAVAGVLTHFRTVNLCNGCIPATIPMHITENGWPTSPTRSYAQQAQVLETILHVIQAGARSLTLPIMPILACVTLIAQVPISNSACCGMTTRPNQHLKATGN